MWCIPGEEWRPVVGFEGLYEVSDLGRVRALPKQDNGRYGIRNCKARIKRLGFVSGYPKTSLKHPFSNNQRYYLVHRLVYEAFVGPIPQGMEIRHKNGIRADCRLENLDVGTRKDNCGDMARHGTNRVPKSQISPSIRAEIREKAKVLSAREIAEEYGMKQRTVSLLIRGLTYSSGQSV